MTIVFRDFFMGGIIDEVKKTSAVLAGLASVTLLAACSKQNDSQNKTKQVLNWTESTTITTQDPSSAYRQATFKESRTFISIWFRIR